MWKVLLIYNSTRGYSSPYAYHNKNHLMEPFEPQLSYLWYHVPPESVEEGIDEFLFVRNHEDLQHVIH